MTTTGEDFIASARYRKVQEEIYNPSYDIVYDTDDGKFYLKNKQSGEIRMRKDGKRRRGYQSVEAATEGLDQILKNIKEAR